jgi:predicted PurR-regulated permease PerM
VVASGIFEQADAMTAQVRRGVAALATALEQWQFSGDTVRSFGEKALANLPTVASGAANFFTSGLSGTFAFFIGSFSALLLLYYLLLDWKGVTGWMAGNLGLPRDLGESLIADATGAVREYFLALTLSSVVVSVIIGGTIYLLGLPLALTVGLVTMLTSYVPYLGAIVAGAFACLVALGSGDLGKAVLVLAVVLVVQNVVQTVIQNKLASSRLQMHPIVTFTTVIGGGILLGILGAALANPVTATVLIFRKHLAARETADEGETG